jgi:putative transposase
VKIYKAYKFRLYPNNIQREQINKTIGSTRFAYNHYLDKKIKAYSESKTKISCYECIKDLSANLNIKYPWLKEVDSISLRCALFDLDDAFQNFFRGKGYPRFKSKNNQANSYRANYINNNIRIDLHNKVIRLPKLKDVSIRGYRTLNKINGRIINATISKYSNGKYYVSILVEEDKVVITNKEVSIVGIDLGIKDIVTTSDGEKYGNEKVMSKYEKRLKRIQRSLSRKIKGSNNYYKTKKKLSVLYSKIKNARKYITDYISNKIVKEHDIIVTETLKIKNMVKNHKLSKSIMDATWYELIRKIKYKSEWDNKKMYQIDTYYPSSKECSVCGARHEEVSDLSIREFECSECHHKHDRDINASINIMFEGLRRYIKEQA